MGGYYSGVVIRGCLFTTFLSLREQGMALADTIARALFTELFFIYVTFFSLF